jgi:hypothetical protein
MTASLTLACVWALVGCGIGALPSRFHWRGAVALIATGIPLLGWVTLQNGALVGLLMMVAGASLLRWPLLRLGQWAARMLRF